MTASADRRPQLPRRRWQFTLRRLLVFVVLLALGSLAWRTYVEPFREEQRVMALVEGLGGRYTAGRTARPGSRSSSARLR